MEKPGTVKTRTGTSPNEVNTNKLPTIETFGGKEEADVIDLWNQCLVRDPITTDIFRRKILLDENFDPRGCLVAFSGGRAVGFSVALRRKHPYYGAGLEQGTGWITVFFVHPDFRRSGLGEKLIEASESFLKSVGVTAVYVSSYTPNYFAPGIDLDSYPESHTLLRKLGYRRFERVYSMRRSLLDFEISAEGEEASKSLDARGISIRVFEPMYISGLLNFLGTNYPGDLFRVAFEELRHDPNTNRILVAVQDRRVVGFSHYENEHFGPFAIDQSLSGMGVGTCLYDRTALQMKEKGIQNLWLAWANGHAKDFYYRRGLKVTRRYEIMLKELK